MGQGPSELRQQNVDKEFFRKNYRSSFMRYNWWRWNHPDTPAVRRDVFPHLTTRPDAVRGFRLLGTWYGLPGLRPGLAAFLVYVVFFSSKEEHHGHLPEPKTRLVLDEDWVDSRKIPKFHLEWHAPEANHDAHGEHGH